MNDVPPKKRLKSAARATLGTGAFTGDIVEASEVVVRGFVERINNHDVPGIIALCTQGHRFVDSLGQTVTGHAHLRNAWAGYFGLVPDYRIEIEALVAANDVVLLAGEASGTVAVQTSKGRHWRIPAAWRARVRGGQVELWQVYADNTRVRELLAGDV